MQLQAQAYTPSACCTIRGHSNTLQGGSPDVFPAQHAFVERFSISPAMSGQTSSTMAKASSSHCTARCPQRALPLCNLACEAAGQLDNQSSQETYRLPRPLNSAADTMHAVCMHTCDFFSASCAHPGLLMCTTPTSKGAFGNLRDEGDAEQKSGIAAVWLDLLSHVRHAHLAYMTLPIRVWRLRCGKRGCCCMSCMWVL